MQISFNDIDAVIEFAVAQLCADKSNEVRKSREAQGNFSAESYIDAKTMFDNERLFTTKYSKLFLRYAILAGIQEYHDQLREKLLESGIDIGEMDMESDNMRKGLCKYYGINENDEDDL